MSHVAVPQKSVQSLSEGRCDGHTLLSSNVQTTAAALRRRTAAGLRRGPLVPRIGVGHICLFVRDTHRSGGEDQLRLLRLNHGVVVVLADDVQQGVPPHGHLHGQFVVINSGIVAIEIVAVVVVQVGELQTTRRQVLQRVDRDAVRTIHPAQLTFQRFVRLVFPPEDVQEHAGAHFFQQ